MDGVNHKRRWSSARIDLIFLSALATVNTPASLVSSALVVAERCWSRRRWRYLLVFFPGLWFLPSRRDGSGEALLLRTHLLWLLALGGMILVYAKWWAWYGGAYWGPRFFLMASFPASLALATRLRGES